MRTTTLKGYHGSLYEEMSFNLWYGLQDYMYARELVRGLGPEERGRFDEVGWTYGDPSMMNGDPTEVFCYQADEICKILFGSALGLDLTFLHSDDPALYDLLATLRGPDGLPAGLEEEVLAEARGDSAVLIAELDGEPETVWRVRGALPQIASVPLVLHYDPASEPGLRAGPRERHIVLVYEGVELYPDREIVHERLFDALRSAHRLIGDGGRGRSSPPLEGGEIHEGGDRQ